ARDAVPAAPRRHRQDHAWPERHGRDRCAAREHRRTGGRPDPAAAERAGVRARGLPRRPARAGRFRRPERRLRRRLVTWPVTLPGSWVASTEPEAVVARRECDEPFQGRGRTLATCDRGPGARRTLPVTSLVLSGIDVVLGRD